MNRFKVTALPLEGLKLVERSRIGDERGFLSRLFCSEDLKTAGWIKPVIQINHTLTEHAATVRGIHFQKFPHMEMKLVTCIRGEVWDVAVDLRKNSSTFLNWHAELLSAQNGKALLIPEGFGHGFQSMTKGCELIYLHTEAYSPNAEAGLRFNDPVIDIHWPLPITIFSDRDNSHPLITKDFKGI
jgi:dTDP-4-dehydrorhamnose 3,5-epimerase